MRDLFAGLENQIEFDFAARETYESRVASRDRVLDVGGRNAQSASCKRLQRLGKNPSTTIVSTDIFDDYGPDIVDDICDTQIPLESFDGVYCSAILEHVTEYWKAISGIHGILKKGGEAFFYVPFFWPFHDRTDFHRFTFTEVGRMLSAFDAVRIMVPGRDSGFGSVLWQVLSFGTIVLAPRLHSFLSIVTNLMIQPVIFLGYLISRPGISFRKFSFYFTYLYINQGFCAHAVK